PGWSTVRVAGRDRLAFLHNMCTNDVRTLPPHSQCEAFFTDVKGKIVGHVFILVDASDVLLVTPGGALALIAHLDRYIIREDVQLADASAEIAWQIDVAATAPRAAAPAEFVGRTESGAVVAPCLPLGPGATWRGLDPGATAATAHGEAVWHALRIEAGWPLFGRDFDGSHLPQEVNRDAQAISFRKGCYLGQETIARIDALGHVNKRLATVRLSAKPHPEGQLRAGETPVGRITSATWSPRLGAWLALAMIRRGHNEPGVALDCEGAPAVVVETPAAGPAQQIM
ncbi:MAG TPA: glycine cleavage T C-terminal barrel domain-containing protein, partial [Lacipirellulaceae bacterium]|nr:glycine cleavage T C-terminal barrel domain-containing protein [Lacipirellulaceae bacterium]